MEEQKKKMTEDVAQQELMNTLSGKEGRSTTIFFVHCRSSSWVTDLELLQINAQRLDVHNQEQKQKQNQPNQNHNTTQTRKGVRLRFKTTNLLDHSVSLHNDVDGWVDMRALGVAN